jgi:CheY-like chemotaxis protein
MVKESYQKALKYMNPRHKTFKPIELLILDFEMPVKMGWQVVTELKKFYQV